MIEGAAKARTLKERALRGGSAALIGFGASQAIRLASNLVMTRLLAPDAFGLMGITLTLQIWLAMASDLGVKSSIIRSTRGDDMRFLGTARTIELARSALIAIVLCVGAALLPAFTAAGWTGPQSVFSDPRLPIFIYCIAFSVIVAGFTAPKAALYDRAVNLGPLIALDIGCQAISVVMMILAAMAGMGPYALAFGAVVAAVLRMAGSYVLLKGPTAPFVFDRAHFLEILNYGKWLLIASTFGFMAYRGDQFVFGAVLPIGDYSLYAIATIITLAAQNLIEQIQARVIYPVFSELHRDRPQDLTRAYRKTQLVFFLGCAGLFLCVVVFADLAVKILYSDRYAGVAHYLRLGAVVLLTMPFKLFASIVLTGGDSRNFTLSTLPPGLALFIGAPLVYRSFGADMAIVFAALTPLLATPINAWFARRYIAISGARELALAGACVVAGILLVNFG
jgi:O-antigen/teichoic acid export membrane protein